MSAGPPDPLPVRPAGRTDETGDGAHPEEAGAGKTAEPVLDWRSRAGCVILEGNTKHRRTDG